MLCALFISCLYVNCKYVARIKERPAIRIFYPLSYFVLISSLVEVSTNLITKECNITSMSQLVENIASLVAAFSFMLLSLIKISNLWRLDLAIRVSTGKADSFRDKKEQRIILCSLRCYAIVYLILGATIIIYFRVIDNNYMNILLGSNFLLLSIMTLVVNLKIFK